MGQPKKVGKIEVEEDLQFLKKEWRGQRIGWGIVGVLLLAGMLGAFGRGPFTKSTIGNRQILAAEFARVIRHGAADPLKIYVGPGAPSDSTIDVAISRAYLAAFTIEDIQPEPEAQRAAGEYIVYEFNRDDPRNPLEISLSLRPEKYGRLSARIQLNVGGALELRQFIMP